MFALIAWTSLIIQLGFLRASTFGKSGHAFIVYRGLDVSSPKSSDKCLLS